MTDTVCVVGLGYVGLPLAVALSKSGVVVVGVDTSSARCEQLQAGDPGIEDVTADDLVTSLSSGSFVVTSDVANAAQATAYIVCVPTPLVEHHPDLSAVASAARAIASVLKRGDLVVLESTTYPGTTQDFFAPILEASGLARGGDFLLAYSPERIDPGNKTFRLETTPKVVGGIDAASTDAAARLYERIVPGVIRVSSPREAEMAKLLENTFRHINIALVNEMAIFCHELGIDLWQAIDAAATKPFGFMPFYPGPGVGGHCIPVDPSYLSWHLRSLGYQFRFVDLAEAINARMPAYVVERASAVLNRSGIALSRAKILCVGAAYKAGVADLRESPALEVMGRLMRLGADVHFHDPHVAAASVDGATLSSVPLTPESIASYDLVLVLTPHQDIDFRLVGRYAQAVLDTRNVTRGVEGAIERL